MGDIYLVLKFPDIQPHFVRGYFDGDGSTSWKDDADLRISFLGTFEFLTRLREILSVTTNVGKTWSKAIVGNIQAKRVRDWMYQNREVCLPRKRRVAYRKG